MYSKCEDLKRLKFIQDRIQKLGKALDILEIGCGNGNICFQVAHLGHQVLGIDLSEESIHYANEHFRWPNLTYKTIAAEDISGQSLYDVIICSEVLEHLYEPDKVLSQISRMLKPNGITIVTVPNGKGPRERLITRPIQKLRKNGGILWKLTSSLKAMLGYKGTTIQSNASSLEHIQFFSLTSLRNLAQNAGFQLIEIRPANFIEAIFPLSLITKVIKPLQKLDCRFADVLPVTWSSGFYTVMAKK
jgi:2-polyprenyl-3-methyl-5-hydroxy-6-metoxy-1,4-benzoquinol methylase